MMASGRDTVKKSRQSGSDMIDAENFQSQVSKRCFCIKAGERKHVHDHWDDCVYVGRRRYVSETVGGCDGDGQNGGENGRDGVYCGCDLSLRPWG